MDSTQGDLSLLLPLRRVVRNELRKPMTLDAFGIGDLADRLTLAVAAYMGTVVGPQPEPVPQVHCLNYTAHGEHLWSQRCPGWFGPLPGTAPRDWPGVPEGQCHQVTVHDHHLWQDGASAAGPQHCLGVHRGQ